MNLSKGREEFGDLLLWGIKRQSLQD